MRFLVPFVVAFERFFNPLTARILASPFHWLLSRWLIEVRYTGRRTGRTFAFPVIYARHDEKTLTALVGQPDAKTYWRNFTAEAGTAEVSLRGESVWATVLALTEGGPEAGALLRSYAAARPSAARAMDLPSAISPDADFEKAAADNVVLRIAAL